MMSTPSPTDVPSRTSANGGNTWLWVIRIVSAAAAPESQRHPNTIPTMRPLMVRPRARWSDHTGLPSTRHNAGLYTIEYRG